MGHEPELMKEEMEMGITGRVGGWTGFKGQVWMGRVGVGGDPGDRFPGEAGIGGHI